MVAMCVIYEIHKFFIGLQFSIWSDTVNVIFPTGVKGKDLLTKDEKSHSLVLFLLNIK